MSVSKYWANVTDIANKQAQKGLSKYGMTLEDNPAEILERLRHLQEELIDALQYIEWVKEQIHATQAKACQRPHSHS